VTLDVLGADRLRVRGLDAATVGRVAFAAGVEVLWLAERADGVDLEQLFFTLTSASTGRR